MPSRPRRALSPLLLALLLALALALALAPVLGCASAQVEKPRTYDKLAQAEPPVSVIIYDFDFADQDEYDLSQSEKAAKVREEVASMIMLSLQARGLPVRRQALGIPSDPGHVLVRGRFVALEEGSRFKRVVIGFGAGATELRTRVQVLRTGVDGAKLSGQFFVRAKGARTPGIITPIGLGSRVGIAVGSVNQAAGESSDPVLGDARNTAAAIAEELERFFRVRGWMPRS